MYRQIGIILAALLAITNAYSQGVSSTGRAPIGATTQFSYGTVSCGDGLDEPNTGIQQKGPKPLAIESADTCGALYKVGQNLIDMGYPEAWRLANDTLRRFIESCALSSTAANGFPAFTAFGDIGFAVQGMDTVNERWIDLRDWLKRVLYLNLDTAYYCSDVEEMFTTFQYRLPNDVIDYGGIVSIVDYLQTTNHCPWMQRVLQERRDSARARQVRAWRDTVADPLKTPLDTENLSIDSIGFSILRGPQFGAVASRSETTGEYLGDLVATKNPFADETTLETTLHDATMLRLEVFDVLGKQLYSENRFYQAGAIQWRLDGRDLPKGTLYVRVSTNGGAVRTIKLIREK